MFVRFLIPACDPLRLRSVSPDILDGLVTTWIKYAETERYSVVFAGLCRLSSCFHPAFGSRLVVWVAKLLVSFHCRLLGFTLFQGRALPPRCCWASKPARFPSGAEKNRTSSCRGQYPVPCDPKIYPQSVLIRPIWYQGGLFAKPLQVLRRFQGSAARFLVGYR